MYLTAVSPFAVKIAGEPFAVYITVNLKGYLTDIAYICAESGAGKWVGLS